MPWPQKRRIIGTKVRRLDGPEKATGTAKYSFDINRPGLLHARILRCPHAHARVKNIDTAPAEKVAGFRAVHALVQVGGECTFAGYEVVAIAADTEEHAEDCMRAIRVTYEVLPHQVKEDQALQLANQPGTVAPGAGGNPPPSNVAQVHDSSTPNFANAFDGLPVVVENTYRAPVITHQCLESHGLVAQWDDKLENLTVYASTQAVPNTAGQLATHFKIPATRVRCITHYMGGGFGSKFGPDIQGIAAAELARKAKAPVKLMLDRAEEVTVGGMRPSATGRVKIGAQKNGTIMAFEADCYGTPGVGAGSTVNFQLLPYVYAGIPNSKRRVRTIRLNMQRVRAMRAPGHPQSCYLTESAVDDLAARLNMNPLQLRLQNLPPNAGGMGKLSYTAIRHTLYTQEIEIARKLSGWDKKWHPPGQGKGPIKHGIGMALHTWGGAGRANNDVHVTISNDGSVLVRSSTQDLGTGARTVLAIVVAEILGLEASDITVRVGESDMGRSTPSGGSTTCPGTAPAALNAAERARTSFLARLAQALNVQATDLVIETGAVRNTANNTTMTWRQACARLGMNTVAESGDWTAGLSDQGVGGVQIAEVRVDTETGVVTCTRFVAVQDCGLIINKQGCESQVAGGVIMGINYALFEEAILDRVTGRQVNPDMEFYKLGGIQDMPQVIVHMHDMPDRGVIGIGEPPTVSTLAAVGNAVFNAIGVRVAEAPFTPERVLAALNPRKGGNGR
jgi:xanthine dehydrogenase YagR molybdenum-binding subunit